MSSASSPNQVIEHVVLIKVKPSADPSAVAAMLNDLNSLASLDIVIHSSAGPVTRCRSKYLTFTHILHCRYRSKSDLATYIDHPTHVSIVSNYVKPILEDVMTIDWVVDDFSGPVQIPPNSAARFAVLKLKEGSGEIEKKQVLDVVRGIKEKFPSIQQFTVGENFTPGRGKGYSIGSIAILNGAKELEALDPESELANQERDKVGEYLDDVVALDYLVPASAQSASLQA